MSGTAEGRQSPPPEEQLGKQGTTAPSNAKGVDQGTSSKINSDKTLQELESNPSDSSMDTNAKKATHKPETRDKCNS
ncbi:hypothetical protein BGHDH14_bghG005298000002001 [Blumeria hordei DH14]|uniref:Uncharacterized protein n=1 Tax=Blumeria graminis f. sp. hordei (strain DH14) TaxID=546991 RepID=N1JFH5_BLUG1|nr:hypothetical protein BGHDH14_bghG005298000002001 [Blumeria hordei DH14]